MFICSYWSSHPGLIWGLLGWWGTLGGIGAPSVPGFGSSTSLLKALSNTRTDGFGALYREGTASWLNSMANHRFPFTTNQVRDSFVAALHSDRAAAAQARLFKLANEGHLKPRASNILVAVQFPVRISLLANTLPVADPAISWIYKSGSA